MRIQERAVTAGGAGNGAAAGVAAAARGGAAGAGVGDVAQAIETVSARAAVASSERITGMEFLRAKAETAILTGVAEKSRVLFRDESLAASVERDFLGR
jgi:hypothetical protein